MDYPKGWQTSANAAELTRKPLKRGIIVVCKGPLLCREAREKLSVKKEGSCAEKD
jgi:hypothetical protein